MLLTEFQWSDLFKLNQLGEFECGRVIRLRKAGISFQEIDNRIGEGGVRL